MNREKLAWAAGFFDGEGHISCHQGKHQSFGADGHYYNNLQIVIKHAGDDTIFPPDELLTFHEAVKLGRVKGPYQRSNPKHKEYYHFTATSFEDVQAIVAMLWPWLNKTKRQQAKAALRSYIKAAGRKL